MKKILLIGVIGSLVILLFTNTAYLNYMLNEGIGYTEIGTGTCNYVFIDTDEYKCPKSSFIISNSSKFHKIVSSLYPEVNKTYDPINFSQSSVLFLYVNLFNAGWNYNVIGMTIDEGSLQVHILKQRVTATTTHDLIEYYHLFLINIVNMELVLIVTEQLQGMTWLAISSQFTSVIFPFVLIIQLVRDKIIEEENKIIG